ncbi:cyclase family protein [Candidatus Poribacteria bacterium]
MHFKRLVDLSHIITPETGSRPVQIEMVPTPEFGYFPEDQWYIMHNVAFLDHVGTHVEVPYHVVEQGDDLSEVPLERFCGDAIILNLTAVEPGSDIALSTIQKAAEEAGGLKEGDIVFCRFDFDRYYDQPDHPKAPCFTAESIQWLVDQGMKMMGVDTGGIELPSSDPRAPKQYNHHLLMDKGIPLIENLAHMDQLKQSRVTVFAFPVGIQKLDSFPLRVVAMEG